jgi:hypothetical protein
MANIKASLVATPMRLAYEVGKLHGEPWILKETLSLRKLGEMFVGEQHVISRESKSSVLGGKPRSCTIG